MWALLDNKIGKWREDKLESWDEKLKFVGVVFRDDRSLVKLATDIITLCEYSHINDQKKIDMVKPLAGANGNDGHGKSPS